MKFGELEIIVAKNYAYGGQINVKTILDFLGVLKSVIYKGLNFFLFTSIFLNLIIMGSPKTFPKRFPNTDYDKTLTMNNGGLLSKLQLLSTMLFFHIKITCGTNKYNTVMYRNN